MSKKLIETPLFDSFDIPDKKEIKKNYKKEEALLFRSYKELNDIQTNLLDIISSQDEKIDKIENNLLSTNNDIERGESNVIQAQKYYFSYTPIFLGILLGGMGTAPLGMLLNIKVGSLLMTSGSILGGYSGYKLQK